jgi:hypothetical protein
MGQTCKGGNDWWLLYDDSVTAATSHWMALLCASPKQSWWKL